MGLAFAHGGCSGCGWWRLAVHVGRQTETLGAERHMDASRLPTNPKGWQEQNIQPRLGSSRLANTEGTSTYGQASRYPEKHTQPSATEFQEHGERHGKGILPIRTATPGLVQAEQIGTDGGARPDHWCRNHASTRSAEVETRVRGTLTEFPAQLGRRAQIPGRPTAKQAGRESASFSLR